MDLIYIDIYKYGIYYNPACKNYNEEIEVGCDRCMKLNISTCIGLREYDICLECNAEIEKIFEEE